VLVTGLLLENNNGRTGARGRDRSSRPGNPEADNYQIRRPHATTDLPTAISLTVIIIVDGTV
jgi:hypothetical protein